MRSTAEDQARAALLDRVKEIIANDGGSLQKVDEWGKKRFAYEIDHMTEGYYYILTFQALPHTLDEVTRVLKITDDVVRDMPVRLDEKVAVAAESAPTSEE